MKKFAILTVLLIYFTNSYACTTIIVGKNATNDGSVIIARNVDSLTNKPVHFLKHQKPNGKYIYRSLENKFSYMMPSDSQGYSGIPDWNTKNQSYEEAGFNDDGVAISATETILSNARTLKLDPYNKESGIKEDSITSVILPQITSARDGVLLLGKIIEQYGSGEGFGVAFADKNEAWYLENAGGHLWVAVRIPDDKYFVAANQSRIGNINLLDRKNVLAATKLLIRWQTIKTSNIANNGLAQINFFAKYSENSSNDINYNRYRVLTLQHMYTPSYKNGKQINNQLPMFLRPDHLLTIDAVENGLQNYYNDSKNDPYTYKNPRVRYRPISVFRSQESHILQLRSNLPAAIANIEYLALGMTSLSVYVPFYQGANIPYEYQIGTDTADNVSAFWRFRKLQTLVMQDFPQYAPIVKDAYIKANVKIAAAQKNFEFAYLSQYKKDPIKAEEALNLFNNKIVSEVLHQTDDLSNIIFTDMTMKVNQKYLFLGNDFNN